MLNSGFIHLGLTILPGQFPDISLTITKTCLYNFDPLKPHFYIVKLGFTGVYIIFLISAQKHRLWGLTSTHNLCFEQKFEQYHSFLSENFPFLEVKFSIYLNRRVFVMTNSNFPDSTGAELFMNLANMIHRDQTSRLHQAEM